ncbi:hypothetical protein QQ045_014527 [Rhodiola kirilowii]
MVGVWVIWYNRNLQVHGKTGMRLDWCYCRVRSLLSQFERKALMGYVQASVSWGGQKALHFFSCGQSQLVIRGYVVVAIKEDTILSCSVKWSNGCSSAYDAECLALLEGMSLADS